MNNQLIWKDGTTAIEWKGSGVYLPKDYESTGGLKFNVLERVQFPGPETVEFKYSDLFAFIGYEKVGAVLESALRVALIYPSSVYEEELYYAVKTLLNSPEPKE